MGKENREKRMYVGVVLNYAAEVKLFLSALLILCSLATLLQFLPSRFTISISDLRLCSSASSSSSSLDLSLDPPPTTTLPLPDNLLPNGILKRAFNPFGYAAYNFITMATYRGGLDNFAIVGLSSKPLHVYANPTYQCQWIPNPNPNPNNSSNPQPINGSAYKILPDWGYGRVYTVVVVNCTFPLPINDQNQGGKLILYASTSGGGDRNFNVTDTIQVLTETPGQLNASLFSSKPKYEYLYCGSPLYGNLSPQRVREWLAYHIRLLGVRSHFVIYDAGGVHEDVFKVLKPWIDLGYVSLHDIREQERFDGYYHNQFMVVNDCLHRYKFMGKWMFFFDMDEFIYVPPKNTIKSVLDSLSEYTQITIEQMPMNSKLCLSEDAGRTYRKWGFEKLVYKDVKRGIRRDRKYAVQPRRVYATGVHMSENVDGKTTHKTEGLIKYFHYHGTIANRREPCRSLSNLTQITLENTPFLMDTTMRQVAGAVKRFELKMIGNRLQTTRQ